MALVYDNRHNLQGGAGIHALIAGVSHYTHLPDGGGPPAKKDWGLPQLTATALTGYKIYRWLIDHRDVLPKPLATVRLLLSPSAAEASKIAAGMSEIKGMLEGKGVTLVDTASPCTLQAFVREARVGLPRADLERATAENAVSDHNLEYIAVDEFHLEADTPVGIARTCRQQVLAAAKFHGNGWRAGSSRRARGRSSRPTTRSPGPRPSHDNGRPPACRGSARGRP